MENNPNNQKTHWKKNNDSAYISGEDLRSGLKGLKPEMVVFIEKFNDSESFDQNKQAKIVVTGLFLKELGGQSLYKPVILNKTNAKFFVKETGSDYMEDWLNIPVKIYAQPDKRHGYVVRFKSHILPVLVEGSENFENCKKAITSGGFTIDQIKLKYKVSEQIEKLLTAKS